MIPDITLDETSVFSMGWLRENVSFPIPEAQTETIIIPGRNSPIRYTEALGRVSYKPRSFSLTFSMLGSRQCFDEMVSEIANKYSGKLTKVYTSEEPDLFITGTLTLSADYAPLSGKGQLVITCEDADSYRYHKDLTEVTMQLQGIRTVTLTNDAMPVIPTVITEHGAALSWQVGEDTFRKTLSAGTWEIPELELVSGANEVAVQTNGTITFRYREGRL